MYESSRSDAPISLIELEKHLVCHFGKPINRYDHVFIFNTDTDAEYASFAYLLDRENDIVYGSGSNHNGVLAIGCMHPIKNRFEKIESLSGMSIIDMDAGKSHVLALTKDGKVLGWGGNNCGQVGDGTR